MRFWERPFLFCVCIAIRSIPVATTSTATTPAATTTTTSNIASLPLLQNDFWQIRGGGGGTWLSALQEAARDVISSAAGNTGGDAKGENNRWASYKCQNARLAQRPDDAELQLATAEALLKWMRYTTNGNFPRASTGKVSHGDSSTSRMIWRKHAPEALRLLRAASAYVLKSEGHYDVAKYRFLHAEASTYLSSAKGILRAALQADAVTFRRNVKPLINEHPFYQGGVGHTFLGAFHLVAPWPVHDLAKAQAHFDTALNVDPRCRRNHYCRGLVALAKGETAEAQESFRQAVRCKPTSPEEEDVSEFFLTESRGALRALDKRLREKAAVGDRGWRGKGRAINSAAGDNEWNTE